MIAMQGETPADFAVCYTEKQVKKQMLEHLKEPGF